MADRRAMRGSRLGAVSYETDRTHNLAPRQIARYRTENGEEFEIPLADDAEIPGTWECRNASNSRNCSRSASRSSSHAAAGSSNCHRQL